MLRKAGFGLAVSLGLTACDGELPDFRDLARSAGGNGGSKAVGQDTITVTRKKVELSATNGFCVDPVSTNNADAQAFVVFGNCAAITGNPDQPQPYLQAVVTATVSSSGLTGEGAIAPQADQLLEFFQTVQGRAALSRSGQAATVAVDDGFVEDGAIYLHVQDSSPSPINDAQKTYWRSYFDAGGSVVAISVIGLGETPLSKSGGLTALRGFVERNARTPLFAVSQSGKPAAVTEQPSGLLDRLFP